jgi:flagellar basal body-associated protein FliL
VVLVTDSGLTWLILAVGFAFFLTAFFLYHFMVFRVNKNLPPNERVPRSLTFGPRDRLAADYKSQYPRSIVYQLTLLCAFSLITLAGVLAGIRVWEAATGR